MSWYLGCWKKYVDFTGRATRMEYWQFFLWNLIFGVFLILISEFLFFIYFLAMLLPAWAVWVRRLHDTNRSAWWVLLVLVPLVGNIGMTVILCSKGTEGSNDYGE